MCAPLPLYQRFIFESHKGYEEQDEALIAEI